MISLQPTSPPQRTSPLYWHYWNLRTSARTPHRTIAGLAEAGATPSLALEVRGACGTPPWRAELPTMMDRSLPEGYRGLKRRPLPDHPRLTGLADPIRICRI